MCDDAQTVKRRLAMLFPRAAEVWSGCAMRICAAQVEALTVDAAQGTSKALLSRAARYDIIELE
jgi:hypothetical protein